MGYEFKITLLKIFLQEYQDPPSYFFLHFELVDFKAEVDHPLGAGTASLLQP